MRSGRATPATPGILTPVTAGVREIIANVPLPLRVPVLAALAVFALGLAGVPGLTWAGDSATLYDALLLTAPLLCIAGALRRPTERATWLLFAVGTASYAMGDITNWPDGQPGPSPSVADVFWLGLFPFLFAGLWLLARARLRGIDRRVWLDGLIAGLGLAALSASIVFRAVVDSTDGQMVTVLTNLAYPAADLLALIFLTVLLSAGRARADRVWQALAAGIAVFLVTDSIYLVQISSGSYVAGTMLDLGWPLAVVLIGAAAWQPAWQPERKTARDDEGASIVLPVMLVVLCVALLVYDHFDRTQVLAVSLAAAAIVAAVGRLLLTYRTNCDLLRISARAALTDELTRLGNRAKLLRDLRAALSGGRPTVLAFFDLDGFKLYNDTYGHPAGDALLRRLAERLAAAMPTGAEAYRMGGDEFCALLPWEGEADIAALTAPACAALSEQGEGFSVTTSWGHALLPHEATSEAQALAIADHRLYEDKGSGRVSALDQAHEVLRRVLDERDQMLGIHLDDVARLAERTGRELGLDEREVQRVILTAELHDIGKSAIPDAILFKPAPLDAEEVAFMRRHTIIGERILAGAPALSAIAPLVRASHERVDGQGYPDGLAGDRIPLAARIVFVCDAFSAMTSERPYSRPRPPEDAIGELRACAGTQFDAQVVEAFARIWHRQDAGVSAHAGVR